MQHVGTWRVGGLVEMGRHDLGSLRVRDVADGGRRGNAYEYLQALMQVPSVPRGT